MTHKDKLDDANLEALEVILQQSSDLATTYHLKEKFFEFMLSKGRTEAANRLNFFILATQSSNLSDFKSCLTMLGNWSKYILNAFEYTYPNS